MEYIDSAKDEGGDACVFCDKPASGDDLAAYILARTGHAFAMLNAYPYNPGHLMVAPFRHLGELEGLQPDELAETTDLLQRSVHALKEVSGPHGFNVGMNLGRVAGAGIPGHVHWHLVPRWNGDTNFMGVVGETRVLPELLAETYAKLKPLF
jgi:ATP adenylyltransferase